MTTQQDCSVGLAIESTYGTPVTPTRWYEFTDEKFEWKPTRKQGEGLRVAAPLARASRRALVQLDAAGEIDLEWNTVGGGLLLQLAMGQGSSSLVSTGVYQQNYLLATTDYLPSATIQKGIPPLGGGAALPHTFDGCVCSSLEIDAPNNDLVSMKSAWVARRMQTSVGYVAPTYGVYGENLTFVGGTISVGSSTGVVPPGATTLGSVITPTAGLTGNITDFSMKIDNKLDNGGWRLNGAGLRTRPPAVGLREVTGTLTVEFDSALWRDAWIADSPISFILNLQGQANIQGAAVKPQLQISVPGARIDGDIPNSEKGGVITQTIPFQVLDHQYTTWPFYVSAITGDAAI